MRSAPARRLFLRSLAAILAAGFALRFCHPALPGTRADTTNPLSTLPPGLDSDEAFHTLAALRLTSGGEFVPFFKIDQGLLAAMIYLIALVFRVAGPAAEGGRIASQIAGALILIALPLFARSLFPDLRAAAFFTAAHVAFTFWFVNFSRIGLEQMTAAALMALAVVVFWLWQTRAGQPIYPPPGFDFSLLHSLTPEAVRAHAPNEPGVYEIALADRVFNYPVRASLVIYLGRSRNLRNRLRAHWRNHEKFGAVMGEGRFVFRFATASAHLQKAEAELARDGLPKVP